MPTTTNFIWDDQNYLAEADGSDTINIVYTNEPRQYGNLVSTRISSTTSYHHFDALGSTRQLTNAAGTVTDIWTFDAWGIQLIRTGTTPLRLTWVGRSGYYSDNDNAAIYVRRRVYSSVVARWLSVDPTFLAQLTRLRPYQYCNERPIVLTDHDGMQPQANNSDFEPIQLIAQATWDCNACGHYEINWNYSLPAGYTGADAIIVQKVCIQKTATFCRPDNTAPDELGVCCKNVKTITTGGQCCYFERLFNAGSTIWVDEWGVGGPVDIDPRLACLQFGFESTTADVRAFARIADEVNKEADTWVKGPRMCGNYRPSLGKAKDAADGTPTWWNDYDFSTNVAALVAWNCCNTRSAGGMLYSRNGGFVPMDCG